MASMTMVVFGAGGRVGGHVLQGLRAQGVPVRAVSRRARDFGDGVEAVVADLEEPGSLGPALAGATGAFVYAHPAGVDGFVAAARAAGLARVVLLSSGAVTRSGAGDDPIVRRHRLVEEALERSDLGWTFVRGGVFAANSVGLWARPVRAQSKVRLPYPEATSAPVHEADLAAIAVAALVTGDHDGKAYTVLGPESLTLRAQVGAIAAAVGRPVAVETVSADTARAEMAQVMPGFVVDRLLSSWAASDGRPVPTSALVPELTGHPARTFAQWAVDHADEFR
jgi:uncharacterized protein YbjT (DUF2867 family)